MQKQKNIHPNKNRIIDLTVLSLYEICVGIAVLQFHLLFYQSTFLFFFVPAFYLMWRKTKKLSHILLASIGGIGFAFFTDLFATFNHAWYIPNKQLLLPIRFFGVVPLDDIIWFVGWLLLMLTFYEHFLDRSKKKKLSSHVRIGLLISLALPLATSLIFVLAPALLHFRFAYAAICFSVLPFFIFMLIHKPSLIGAYLKLSLFFIPLCFLFEVTALINHQWSFPGAYIGYISVIKLAIPFEEFFVWIILSSSIVLSYYEFFVEE